MHKEKTSWARSFLPAGVAAILVLVPFWTFFSTWLGSNFGHLEAWRLVPDYLVFSLAVLALYCGLLAKDTRNHLKSSRVIWLYMLYVLLSVVLGSVALNEHRVNKPALIDGLITDLSFMGFFIVTYISSTLNGFLQRTWAKIILIPAVVVVVLGIIQKFLPADFLKHFGYGPNTTLAYQTVDAHSGPVRAQSTLRGPNPLGAYLSFILPAWLGAFWSRPKKLAIGFLAIALVLILSFSRSAVIAALISAGLLLWWLSAKKQRKSLLIIVVGFLIIVSGILFNQRNHLWVQENILHTSSSSTSQHSSNAQRRSALRAGWTDAAHHPLGQGPGSAGPASVHNQPHKAKIAENYYIQVAQETGFAGLLVFMAINIAVVVELWRRRASMLPKILLVSFVGISFVNMLSHAWADQTLAFTWWGLAGLACAAGYRPRR